jgi:hypothetical protein
MLSRATLMYAGLILTCVAAPAFAQDASRDRVELDAAAGRRIFQNVLLADPQAFSGRTRARVRDKSPGAAQPPARTNEASADREEFDAAAGRAVFASGLLAQAESGQPRRPGQSVTNTQRSVRVILASPYGR